MAKLYTLKRYGKDVNVILIESMKDIVPYATSLSAEELKEVWRYISDGDKVELIDEDIAEIHIGDRHILCSFPNPTKEDAPPVLTETLHEGTKGDGFSEEELNELGLSNANSLGFGVRITHANRWTKFEEQKEKHPTLDTVGQVVRDSQPLKDETSTDQGGHND